MKRLEIFRDQFAANLDIKPNDFEYALFSQHDGLPSHHLHPVPYPQ